MDKHSHENVRFLKIGDRLINCSEISYISQKGYSHFIKLKNGDKIKVIGTNEEHDLATFIKLWNIR
jgi:hypothetical protein